MAGKVIKGISWSAVQQFSTQAIQFIVTIILARLLTPDEFGVVAASMIVLTILQVINETGFGAALMQKLDRDETDYFSVFILNIVMGIVLYSLVFFTATFWANLFKSPSLTSVIRLLGLSLIINSFIVVQRTKLLINIDFKTWTIANVTGAIISGVMGIMMAYSGYGVYSLVAQNLISAFISVIIIWWIVKWKPNMIFSIKRIKGLFLFAYKLILARLINTIFNEVYSSVIAVVYNPSQLAFFNRAKSFEYISTNSIISVVQRVSQPLLCEKQNSEEELRMLTLQFIRNTSFIVIPLVVLISSLAKPLIIILLTEKWKESVWILQIISLSGIFNTVSAFNMNIFNATGRTDLALKCEIVKKIVSISIIAVAILLSNFELLVWSYLACALIECMINIGYTFSQIHTSFLSQIKNISGILVCAAIMGIFIYIGSKFITSYYAQLFGLGFTGVILYLVICYLFNVNNFANIRDYLKKHHH